VACADEGHGGLLSGSGLLLAEHVGPLLVSWAEAAKAVTASAAAVKLLVNLNIGLRWDVALTHLKQPSILP
jgi:hypothetical protein